MSGGAAQLRAHRGWDLAGRGSHAPRRSFRTPLIGATMLLMLEDAAYALRQFRQSPGFALAAILTLALGIGANAAIYAVLDAVAFRSLPIRDPQHLVRL